MEFIDYRKPENFDTQNLSQVVEAVSSSYGIEDDDTADTLKSIESAERVSGSTFLTPINHDSLLSESGFEDNDHISAQMLAEGTIDAESEDKLVKKHE